MKHPYAIQASISLQFPSFVFETGLKSFAVNEITYGDTLFVKCLP